MSVAEVIPVGSDELTSGVHAISQRWTLRATSRGNIVGQHPSIKAVLATVTRVAASGCTVLVSGESGTGKELVVAAIHDASPRASRPLVAVNCGAIPENLIESVLFGHARGAFTGAHANHHGLVATAEGGTLFLDEIGELPFAVQVKILRLLQQREYSPVGDSRTIKCDIRVVAATNRDLDKEVAAGRFREDLFYRLNVIQIALPPLRDRGADISGLATHFFKECAARSARDDLVGFSDEAIRTMQAYDWPGNVRALENAVERAVLLAPGPFVEVSDLPPKVRRELPSGLAQPTHEVPCDGIDLRAAVETYENGLIRDALAKTGRNKNRAAQLLGLNRTTLVEMIKRRGL
jgi:sigma-54 specific flagellar transcriptional regulator A